MTDLFEWDEGVERSGLYRIKVSMSSPSGDISVLVAHAGSATVIVLPSYAAKAMHDAIGQHLGLASTHGRAMEIHHDEWSALYVDGKLEVVGATSYVEEKAFALLGVREVTDDSFMQGQVRREGVAQTLVEVDTYRREREKRCEAAASLRSQADALLAQAAEMEKA